MAQFEVLLKMTITSGGFRLQPANTQGLPEISLEHGQSWPEALDSFLSRIIGQVPYRASLEQAETVPGPKPVLSINLRVSLSEKFRSGTTDIHGSSCRSPEAASLAPTSLTRIQRSRFIQMGEAGEIPDRQL